VHPARRSSALKTKATNQSPKRKAIRGMQSITIGMDLGDKTSRYCVIDNAGEVISEGGVTTTRKAIAEKFGRLGRCRMALEVGTHSPWVSRLLSEFGHEVIVANPRQLKLITESSRKSDRVDAQTLARLARVDPVLLRPIRHRSESAQMDLMVIRARAALVQTRTSLVNTVRGLAKAAGERLPKVDAEALGIDEASEFPELLREVLRPLLETVEQLTAKIKAADKEIERIARTRYPETKLLMQVSGVGTLIALTFVLTVEDKERFQKSRDVGCFIGLRPRRADSGERRPQLPITKEGDMYLRALLVQGSHCILSRQGPDTDLKRWGERMCTGGRNAKKRAIVAVARKLAILLHRLWTTGEVYEPLRNNNALVAAA
jgi:transposase